MKRFRVAVSLGTIAGPIVSPRVARIVLEGTPLEYAFDTDAEGVHYVFMPDDFMVGFDELTDGWTQRVPAEWAEVDRGEDAYWRQLGDIWVGITQCDWEDAEELKEET